MIMSLLIKKKTETTETKLPAPPPSDEPAREIPVKQSEPRKPRPTKPPAKQPAKDQCPVDIGKIKFAKTTVESWLTNQNITGVGPSKVKGNPTKRDALLVMQQILEWLDDKK